MDPNINPILAGPLGQPTPSPAQAQPPLPNVGSEAQGLPIPGLDPELSPPVGDVYAIDPLVLSRPVRIKIMGSNKMLTRGNLQQIFPFLMQYAMNGPFLGAIGQNNITMDMTEVLRMMEDAMGTMDSYRIFRPLNEQELQQKQQPPPQAQMEMQRHQQDQQTRLQLGQMKQQTEQMKLQVESMLRNKEINETSAQKILDIVSRQQQHQSTIQSQPDPQAEMMAKMQQGAQQLQQRQAEGQMQLQQMSQKNDIDSQKAQMDLKQTALEHAVKMHQAQQDHQMSLQQQYQKHQQDIQHGQQTHQQGLTQGQASHRQDLQHTQATHVQQLAYQRANSVLSAGSRINKTAKKPSK